MPIVITALADAPDTAPEAPSWASNTWAAITSTGAATVSTAIASALIGALAVYLLMRRPAPKRDLSKHLMYAPLLLVNAAAVYGQVAFFYDTVAPNGWPFPGKLALGVVIALAIESIAVYVGWHAHDALLNKAGSTAARLRRASYVIALIVAGINYAHFAKIEDGNPLGVNAAAIAFGLLSLLSPWLWGLHTRRMQHVQLRKEGVVDAAGATFSGERIRSFPLRAYLARRWSIDHYVTDPRQAWEGYNAELRAQWVVNVDQPGWWLRINPFARVRQLTEAHKVVRADMAEVEAAVTDVTGRLDGAVSEVTSLRADLASAEASLETLRADLAEMTSARDAALRQLEARTSEMTSNADAYASDIADLRQQIASKEAEIGTLRADFDVKEKNLRQEIRQARAEAALPSLAARRNNTSGVGKSRPSKTAAKAGPSDETAVQMLLDAPADPGKKLPSGDLREWSQSAIVDYLRVGWGRAPRLLEAVTEAQRQRAAGDQAVGQ